MTLECICKAKILGPVNGMVDGKVRFGEERIGMVKVFLFLPFLGSKYNTT